MIKKVAKYEYTCDMCGASTEFWNDYRTHIEAARIKGWAISKDRYHCYCPTCAPYFRNTGKLTARTLWELRHPNGGRKNEISN